MSKNYKLRFPSIEEHDWMEEFLAKHIKERFDVVYWNTRPEKIKVGWIFKPINLEDSFHYEESRTRYYINAHLANVKNFSGKITTTEEPLGVNIHVFKRHFKEWLKINNIVKPKFPKAKLIY